MKNLLIKLLLIFFTVNIANAQAWMTSLDIAQKLAADQNKMVLMVWEETTKYPYPVFVNNNKGEAIYIQNLFEDETVSPLIWEYFVPVIVNETQYANLFNAIKDKRSQKYINKFNDDTIKILDINGVILNVSNTFEGFQNITIIIQNYALKTDYIAAELMGYKEKQDFYSAYFLASKYLDFSMFLDEAVRLEIIELSNVYLDEASLLIDSYPTEEQLTLKQRVELLKIHEHLITKRPKKVLRQLKRMNAENVEANNLPVVAFLYYTAYKILNNDKNAALWESKISSVDLKKAQLIINLNSQ